MRALLGIAVALSLVLAACGSSGYGSGRLTAPGKPDEGPVMFTWSAGADATSGPITAVLPDGRRFEGRFMQITSTTMAEDYGTFRTGWAGPTYGWGWGYGPYYDDWAFIRHYSGQLIAQLRGPEDELMRCQFVLEDPVEGPEEGGVGECELSTGERVSYAALRGEDDGEDDDD